MLRQQTLDLIKSALVIVTRQTVRTQRLGHRRHGARCSFSGIRTRPLYRSRCYLWIAHSRLPVLTLRSARLEGTIYLIAAKGRIGFVVGGDNESKDCL